MNTSMFLVAHYLLVNKDTGGKILDSLLDSLLYRTCTSTSTLTIIYITLLLFLLLLDIDGTMLASSLNMHPNLFAL